MSELPDWVVEPLRAVLGGMRVSPGRLRFEGEHVWVRLGSDQIALGTGCDGERGADRRSAERPAGEFEAQTAGARRVLDGGVAASRWVVRLGW